ncbi:MAG TPA: DNA mismatch repair protein MutL, partial [Chthoniobacterales bacterium]
REPSSVHEAVVAAVRRTLESGRHDWQEQFRAPAIELPTNGDESLPNESEAINGSTADFPFEPPPLLPLPPNDSLTAPRHEQAPAAGRDRQFQIIGVLNKLYVLMENADGLVLVDQHAAHERILFEELRRRMEEKGVPSQRLLMPHTFELPPRDTEWVERNLATLEKMGIGIEPFGANTFRIDSLPTFLAVSDPVRFMREVIDGLRSVSHNSSALRLGEDMIAKTVCRHAVKANDPLAFPEVEKLIIDLLKCELPYCCPHGRPTMIQISLGELEKKFGRKA